MILTKEQVFRLYCFLTTLVNDDADIKNIKFRGDDIIVLIEPVKGEIENRGWRITPEGKLVDIPSFFYD